MKNCNEISIKRLQSVSKFYATNVGRYKEETKTGVILCNFAPHLTVFNTRVAILVKEYAEE